MIHFLLGHLDLFSRANSLPTSLREGMGCQDTDASWCQPIDKLDHFPKFRVENKKYLKPPPKMIKNKLVKTRSELNTGFFFHDPSTFRCLGV